MTFNSNQFLRSAISIFVVGFLINFFWESWHGVYLYEDMWGSVEAYVALITTASLGDGLYLTLVYMLGVLLFKNTVWMSRLTSIRIWYIVGAGVALAVFIEYKGIYLLQKWSYLEAMPTIVTLGVSPLAELAVTGLITFYVVGYFNNTIRGQD